MKTRQLSGNWLSNVLEPAWNVKTNIAGVAILRSRCFSDPERGISYCRECVLDVPGKFFAETALVYPQTDEYFPVFGSEYIATRRRSFGAVDFHPPQDENNAIPAEFSEFPTKTVSNSPHYNLNRHFSPILWHKKSQDDFYEDFADVAESRLTRYLAVLEGYRSYGPSNQGQFTPFDTYMAVHDPAHGILKAYFGAEFANDYIRRFLFPNCGRDVELGHVQGNQTQGSGAIPIVRPEPADSRGVGQKVCSAR